MPAWCAELLSFESESANSLSAEIICGPKQLEGEEFQERLNWIKAAPIPNPRSGLRPEIVQSARSPFHTPEIHRLLC
jgi:hypothetical protein